MSTTINSDSGEVPGVNYAVRRLRELESRMRGEVYNFKEKDITYIERIITALHDLETERKSLHEQLEVETIESSKLRHRLAYLPGQVRDEISGAVNAARGSNEAELTRLQTELNQINEDITLFEARHQELEKENAVLYPTRNQVRQQHEEIVMQLNQCLAEKAGKQIVLNETRDKLRETNYKILDIEDGILQLKEDLIQDRAEARQEKKRLKKAVYDTTLKTRDQKEANVAKKKEVDDLNTKLMESEVALSKVKKHIETYNATHEKLNKREKKLYADLNNRLEENEELRNHGHEVLAETRKKQAAFDELKADLESQVVELEQKIREGNEKNVDLSTENFRLNRELNEKTATRNADALQVKASNSKLQERKLELAKKAEEIGRLAQENADMDKLMEELHETHRSIVANKAKQIMEARQKLAEEKQESNAIETVNDTQQNEIDSFNTQRDKMLEDLQKSLRSYTSERDTLLKEGEFLNKAMQTETKTIAKLKDDIEKAKVKYAADKERTKEEVVELEKTITDLTTEISELEENCVSHKPDVEVLEKKCSDLELQTDTTKKQIVALNREKQGLQDAIKQAKKEEDRLTSPAKTLQEDIKIRRADTLDLLKKQAQETREIEELIYNVGVKLRRFIQENDLLEDAIEGFERQIETAKSNEQRFNKTEQGLGNFISVLKSLLLNDWSEDSKMGTEMAERDQQIVDKLSEILTMTEKREVVISNVSGQLQSELTLLGQFLDNVSSRRPKDTRQRIQSSKGSVATEMKVDSPFPSTPVPFSASRRTPLPPINQKEDAP